ncbi:MAG: DNA repair protein RecO [Gemmiger sp.]|uniref:DNA repair protein RecO n=1 Tax=Gemmiger sp. TaxID=2049027 RepID=UPI002E7857F6|nr:DNA repair protein RecO [Gemmiger sp.]MEE0801456.1 DNA repair protein RecO [Gemmiger sp.]
MEITTTGLVLRTVRVGEADQILTILTPDKGLLSASARGSLRLKNKLFSGCGLFCYSEFLLTTGRKTNFINGATVIRVFHGLSRSVEGMALAAYLAELATALAPEPPESADCLRLLLNTMYMIGEGKRPLRQLKAIAELRMMTQTGYMPRVLGCDECGRYEGGSFYLDPVEGRLLCEDCAGKARRTPNLDPGALYALRHICLAEDGKLFGFTLSDSSLKRLGRVSEQYLLAHLEYSPKSLDFLKTVLD